MKYSIFFDGSCPFCTRTASQIEQLDWRNQLTLINLHDTKVLAKAGIDKQAALRRIQVSNADGEIYEGFHAILRISTQIPAFWLFVPILWASFRLGLGDKLYDWIAARRLLFPTPGGCGCQIKE